MKKAKWRMSHEPNTIYSWTRKQQIPFFSWRFNWPLQWFFFDSCLPQTYVYWFTYSFWFFHYVTYKKGVIFSLLNRCFNICSTHAIFNTKLEKLQSIFIQNAYPENLVNRCIASFLHRTFFHSIEAVSVPKKIIHFSLPFTGQHFLQIKAQIKKKLPNFAFHQTNIQFVARPSLGLLCHP